jgi:RNA polymerase sigma-70 factor (ECF subfamily)
MILKKGYAMQLFDIFHTYQRDFIRFSTSLTHQPDDAQDLVQQAYLKSLDHLELFDQMHPEQIKGWFFTTIKRLFIDNYRKQKHICSEPSKEVGTYDVDPLDALMIKDALELLPMHHRQLIVLRYLHGYSSQEIAENLGQNPSTVRSQLKVARDNLKLHFEKKEVL